MSEFSKDFVSHFEIFNLRSDLNDFSSDISAWQWDDEKIMIIIYDYE